MTKNEFFDQIFKTVISKVPIETASIKLIYGIDGVASTSQVVVLNEKKEWVGGDFGGIGYENTMLIDEIRAEENSTWVRMEIIFDRNGKYEVEYFTDDPMVF